MKRGKKYIEAAKLIERGNLYEKEEAVALVKKAATAKFDETIEAHIRTGCDGRHADQQIRGAVVLPHGTGKKVRILVFAKDAKAEEAKAAAEEIAANEYVTQEVVDLAEKSASCRTQKRGCQRRCYCIGKRFEQHESRQRKRRSRGSSCLCRDLFGENLCGI
mgnify:CR=1 FL=1